MMSASEISKAIRMKKKQMADKMDPIDAMTADNEAYADKLSDNHPKEQDEAPASMSEESMSGGHEEEQPDPHQINQPEDGPEKEARKAKIRKMMSRMGK